MSKESDMPLPHGRRGSVFLFALGLLVVMVTTAYAFMSSMRIHRDANQSLQLVKIAEMAAQQGTVHAIEVLHQDYLAQPGLPTHLGLRFNTAFAPIDSLRVGKKLRGATGPAPTAAELAAAKTAANGYQPVGLAGSWEDENENDTKGELLLTTPYNGTFAGHGSYSERGEVFGRGMMLAQGHARYIEPGYYHADLPLFDYTAPASATGAGISPLPKPGKPVSFHLDHPQLADASSADPAIQRGEPWIPDNNNPLYLDGNLVPVPTKAMARYRLRYAVVIEDQSGHMPLAWPAEYKDIDPAVAKSTAFTPTEAKLYDELDNDDDLSAGPPVVSIGTRYADTSYNIMGQLMSSGYGYHGWFLATGAGQTIWKDANSTQALSSRQLLASVTAAGVFNRYDQAAPVVGAKPGASPPNLEIAATSNMTTAYRGPIASWGGHRVFDENASFSGASSLTYTLTPFGRRPVKVANPANKDRYVNSHVDTPWQVNLPTATPETVQTMLYAYMPFEFLAQIFTHRRVQEYDGLDGSGNPKWRDPLTPDPTDDPLKRDPLYVDISADNEMQDPSKRMDFRNLFDPAGSFSEVFGEPGFLGTLSTACGADHYPGTHPSAPGTKWRADLGKDIDINTSNFGLLTSGGQPLPIGFVTAKPPFWGLGMAPAHINYVKWREWREYDGPKSINYGPPVPPPARPLQAGDEQWTKLTIDDFSNMTGGASFTKKGGFYYEHSYYMDVANAFFHTISLVQLAWLPDNGGASDSYPLDGRARFPAGMTNPDLASLLSDGKPQFASPVGLRDADMMDSDGDGDGIVDSPSAFDTIEEVDAQFVRNMGEYPGTSSDPATPNEGLYVVKVFPTPDPYFTVCHKNRAEAITRRPNHNIRTLLNATLIDVEHARGMELVLNDFRLSFFGSSAQYRNFRGIDFDGDLQVYCSAYAGGRVGVETARHGPVIPPSRQFSLAGNFLFQKSHFYRIFVRGEVFDMARNVPVEWTLLESAYAIDPQGDIYDCFNQPRTVLGTNQRDPNNDGSPSDARVRGRVLLQRSHWIQHQSYRPRAYP